MNLLDGLISYLKSQVAPLPCLETQGSSSVSGACSESAESKAGKRLSHFSSITLWANVPVLSARASPRQDMPKGKKVLNHQ